MKMPRKRTKTPAQVSKKVDDPDDDDFFFDDTQSGSERSSHEPPHRNAANARERARMRVLSKAFCRLKTTLPWVPADTKLSKLDTLRLAASYIAHLRALLHEPRSAHATPHPLSLVKAAKTERWNYFADLKITAWPFAFQHGGSLSCTISQRFSPHESNDRNSQIQDQILENCSENYGQEYSENDYEERNYEEMGTNDSCAYSYGYKENYYESRNSYQTDNFINNVN